MADQIKLTVKERSEKGKGPNRRLRSEKGIPGIFYDRHGLNIPVTAQDVPLSKVYRKVGRSQIFELEIERDGETLSKKCLIWQLQYHPVKSVITHVDFFGVDMDKPLKVWVPLHVSGKSLGEKAGGKLEMFKEMVEVQALPADIPKSITIDVTELDINDTFQVADLVMPEGASAVYDNNFSILTILSKGAAAAGEEEEEGEEVAAETEATEE